VHKTDLLKIVWNIEAESIVIYINILCQVIDNEDNYHTNDTQELYTKVGQKVASIYTAVISSYMKCLADFLSLSPELAKLENDKLHKQFMILKSLEEHRSAIIILLLQN